MTHVHAKMRPGGLEVRRFAFWDLVNVKRVVSGRKILDIQLDAHAVRCFGEHSGSDTLTSSILKVDSYRLGCRPRIGHGHPTAAD